MFTKEQINKKYKWKYISFTSDYDYNKKIYMYKVIKSYNNIRENTTLWEDVWTEMEYTR